MLNVWKTLSIPYSQFDFSDSGDVVAYSGQAFHEDAREFDDVIAIVGRLKTLVSP